MLGILATFALVAASPPTIPRFSEHGFERYYCIYKDETMTATLTNWKDTINFNVMEEKSPGEIILLAEKNSMCIHLNNKQQSDFCGINLLAFEAVSHENGEETIHFTVVFDEPSSPKEIPLDIRSSPNEVPPNTQTSPKRIHSDIHFTTKQKSQHICSPPKERPLYIGSSSSQVSPNAHFSHEQISLDIGLPPLPHLPKRFLLDIPVFELPSELESPEKEKLKRAWAKHNGVVLLSPLDIDQLDKIYDEDEEPVVLRFEWLKMLLKNKELYKNVVTRTIETIEPVDESWVSRPICLPKQIITKMFDILNSLTGLNKIGLLERTYYALQHLPCIGEETKPQKAVDKPKEYEMVEAEVMKERSQG